MRRWIKGAIVLALLLLLIPMVVTAQGDVIEGDRAIFGRTFVLESGQTMRGDLAVMGGSVRIEEGALLDGDLSVVGGSVTIDGEVARDVAVFGGSVRLGETAVIRGDLASLGGSVSQEPGARIEGESVEGFDFSVEPPGMPFDFSQGSVARAERSVVDLILRVFGYILSVVLTTLALAVLAFIVALFIPQNTRRVAETATKEPLLSFGVGCLSLPAALLLALVLTVTIIGIPVAGLLALVLIAAGFFGFIGLGYALGDRMLRSADIRSPRPTAAAVAGVVVLWLAWRLIGVIPCLFPVGLIIVSSLALGSVFLSRFGTERFPSPPEPPPDDSLLGPIEPFEPSGPPPPAATPSSDALEQMMQDAAAGEEEADEESDADDAETEEREGAADEQ